MVNWTATCNFITLAGLSCLSLLLPSAREQGWLAATVERCKRLEGCYNILKCLKSVQVVISWSPLGLNRSHTAWSENILVRQHCCYRLALVESPRTQEICLISTCVWFSDLQAPWWGRGKTNNQTIINSLEICAALFYCMQSFVLHEAIYTSTAFLLLPGSLKVRE